VNIAFITLGFNPVRKSGLDISGERLIRGLLSRGHKVTVIACGMENIVELELHPSLKILRVQPDPSNWLGFAWKAARLLEKKESETHFDAIHFWDVHFAYAYRGSYVASLQHSFSQRISTPNSSLRRKVYYNLARYFAERPAILKAKGLIAGSATTKLNFVREYNLSPDQITVAKHGIDINFYKPINNVTSLRNKLGISMLEPVIMFAGFVTPRKGLEYLPEVIQLITPRPRLVLVGKMTPTFRNHFYQLLGPVRSQVIDVGFVPDEEMPLYYSLADLYVSPSLLEGFGLPLAEALACETPVVTFDGGAAAEVVGPGGIIIPTGDTLALAKAISELLQNPDKRNALGKIGRNHIQMNFNLESMIDSMIQAYERFA
jgi:glycosyltransferase involved in cell wall biosynthesis